MVYIDVGYMPDTAIKRQKMSCKCNLPPVYDYSEKYPVHPPFTDIGSGLNGVTRSQIWEKTLCIYREGLNELITNAVKRVDRNSIKNHKKFTGESDQSIDSLMTSFTTVSRISRGKLLAENQAILNFEFLSQFQTMRGEDIKLVVPIILNYQTGEYSIMNPGFKVGDGK